MKSKDVGLIVRAVSKIFNLCGHDPPTSKTDRRTDDMRSQDRALHYSASRGKNGLSYINAKVGRDHHHHHHIRLFQVDTRNQTR